MVDFGHAYAFLQFDIGTFPHLTRKKKQYFIEWFILISTLVLVKYFMKEIIKLYKTYLASIIISVHWIKHLFRLLVNFCLINKLYYI